MRTVSNLYVNSNIALPVFTLNVIEYCLPCFFYVRCYMNRFGSIFIDAQHVIHLHLITTLGY